MNNCVGYQNHRYFVLFLFYLLICSTYITAIIAALIFGFLKVRRYFISTPGLNPNDDLIKFCFTNNNKKYNRSIYYSYYTAFFFIGILCASMVFAMGGFFLWHLYLVLTNQTTIEFQYNRILRVTQTSHGELQSNDFDVGIKKNLEIIFGSSKWYWILLPSLSPLPYDGSWFPRMSNVGSWGNSSASNNVNGSILSNFKRNGALEV